MQMLEITEGNQKVKKTKKTHIQRGDGENYYDALCIVCGEDGLGVAEFAFRFLCLHVWAGDVSASFKHGSCSALSAF